MKDANRNGLQNVEAIVMKTPRKLYFERAADVPNSTWPALLFRGVLPANASDKIQRFRRTFRQKGWVGIWMDSIYDYTHFHSNAHEVLGIAKGPVTLLLGAEAGRRFRLKAGDMLILPAGIGTGELVVTRD